MTLLAESSDAWKVHTSDDIRMGEDTHLESRDEQSSEFVTVDDRIRALELGDNLAEEGVLRASE